MLVLKHLFIKIMIFLQSVLVQSTYRLREVPKRVLVVKVKLYNRGKQSVSKEALRWPQD